MPPPKSNGSVFLPVFHMHDLNRIPKDPEADPAATSRALLWIPSLFEDLPSGTYTTPRAKKVRLPNSSARAAKPRSE